MERVFAVVDIQNVFLNDENKFIVSALEHFLSKNKARFDQVVFFKFVNTSSSNFVKKLGYNKAMDKKETVIPSNLKRYADRIIERTSFSVFVPKFTNLLSRDARVFLAGLDSDACIMASAYHGFDLGYDIRVVKDLSFSKDIDFHRIAFKILNRNLGPIVVNSDSIF